MSKPIKNGNNSGGLIKKVFFRHRRTPKIKILAPFDVNVSVEINSNKDKNNQTTGTTVNSDTTNNTPVTPVIAVADPTPPATTTESTATLISETAIMYMRAKTITFQITGLKPNTKYYPFFSDVYVGQYCSTVSGQLSSNIITDSIGSATGNFYLPGGVFTTGSHTFELVDHVDNDLAPTKPDPLYGTASTTYEANGTLKTMQSQATPEAPIENAPEPTPPNVVNPEPPELPTPITPTEPKQHQCSEWVFEYRIITDMNVKTFTVTTTERLPPVSPSPQAGSTSIDPNIIISNVNYLDTKINDKGQYNHRYSYLETNVSSVKQQFWRGPFFDATRWFDFLPDTSRFRPSGLFENQTVQVTKNWALSREVVACPVIPGFFTLLKRIIDPLAQSFYVDNNIYPNGMYISSIEVFFKTVDQSTSVSLELRNMENGLPGSTILPNGQVIVPGFATAQSDDASMGTIFRFDTPVYLQPQMDYCFVLKSTSLGYNLWCSRVGETDVTTGRVVDTNPYIGTLFKSENDDTWVPDSYEDIKFNIRNAIFDNNVTSNLVFRPQSFSSNGIAQYFATKQSLPLSYIVTTYNTKTITATIPMHGLNSGDYLYATVPVTDHQFAYNGLHYNQLIGEFIVTRIDDDTVQYTAKTGTTVGLTQDYLATRSGSIPIKDGLTVLDYTTPLLPLQPTNYATAKITNPDTFSPSTIPSPVNSPTAIDPPAFLQSPVFTVYTNLLINEAMIDYLGTELESTNITEKLKLAVGYPQLPDGDSPYTERDFIEVEKDGSFYQFDEPRMLAAPRNESDHALELGQESSTVVNINLQSSDKNISPIIDIGGMSLMTKTYKIDNQSDELTTLFQNPILDDFNDSLKNSEILPGKGKAAAKYKSTVVQLSDFYKSMRIYVVGNCMYPAAFDCYIRTSTDESTHRDRNWVWVPFQGDITIPFASSPDKNTMSEWEFVYSNTETFNVFDIKLVFRTTNPSIVPKIYTIRTITDILV